MSKSPVFYGPNQSDRETALAFLVSNSTASPSGNRSGYTSNKASSDDTKTDVEHSVIDSEIIKQQREQEHSEQSPTQGRKRTYSSLEEGQQQEAANLLHLANTQSGTDSYSNTVATAAAAVVSNNQQAYLHSSINHTGHGLKPAVGTPEWHKQRRDNHKEVERRRRENINTGIQALSEIVPNCDKNKGQILSRSVDYIKQLKENESKNIEKWTIEKLLTEQSVAELASRNEGLKRELEHAWKEVAAWKAKAEAKQKK